MAASADIWVADLVRALDLLGVGSDDTCERVAVALGLAVGIKRAPSPPPFVSDVTPEPGDTSTRERANELLPPIPSGRVLPVFRHVDWGDVFQTELDRMRPTLQSVVPLPRPGPAVAPELQSLFRQPYLRDIVMSLGGTDFARGGVHVEALVRELAIGRPIRKIPYRRRWTTRRGVQVIADMSESMQPFWGDVRQLIASFRQFMGPASLTVVEVDGSPWRVVGSAWNAPAYRQPPPGTPVVVLTDFGVSRVPSSGPGIAWHELGRALVAQGSPLRAIVPTHECMRKFGLPLGMRLVPWSHRIKLTQIRRIVRDGIRHDMPLISAGMTDLAEQALSELVAPAVRIEPALLRALRLKCLPQSSADAEAAVWFSERVASRSATGIGFWQRDREALLRALSAHPGRHAARREMSRLHAGQSPALRLEEEACWELVDGRVEQAIELFRPVLAAIDTDPTRRDGLARWAAEAHQRRLPSALAGHSGLNWMYSLTLPARRSSGASGRENEERLKVGVRVGLDAIEIGKLTPPAEQFIEVSAAEPWVQVESGTGSREWHRADPRSVIDVPLSGGTIVVLRNVFGEEYWLNVRQPEPRVETLKIMISCTRADLMPYRAAALRVIEEIALEWRRKWQILPVGMETVTQTGKREYPIEVSKKWVEESDWVVLIAGWHYGMIMDEEGADGLSVTEWEYRYAEIKNKKIFVFLAGAQGAEDAYDGKGDVENLARWTIEQTDEQYKRMRDFRGRVGSRVAAFFRNQAHFTGLLARTLRKALHDKPIPIALGPEILDEAFMSCFDGLRLIARAKDIHDVLHDLRQHLIVRLRDQVAGPWQANGELSQPQERLLNRCLKSHGPLLGLLQREREALDGGENSVLCQHLDLLLARMGGVLMKTPYVDETTDELVQVAEFCETLDGCARSLEKAFSEANRVMLGQQRVFDTLHQAMKKKLDEAASKQRLTQIERDTFTEEITKIAAHRGRLIDALQVHAGWQSVHDETVMLANLVSARNFERRLRDFAKVRGPQLHVLCTRVCDALERDGEVDRPLDDALARLAGAIDALGEVLAGPAAGLADDEIFRRFCTPFDESFYLVDKRTKRVIARSRERVEELEKSFRALGKKQAGAGK